MDRRIYINGASALSIQDTLRGLPQEFTKYRQRFVPAIEPDFKEFISPMAARRMSRIIKRAITVSRLALKDAALEMPQAIIFGTGLGCIEDTEKFLNAMLDQDEQFLQPSFFIQSTHNTISAQVAMQLSCHGYNNTHVQRRLSFESALLDAYMLFQLGSIDSALVGGHDELTPSYFTLLNKAGYYTFNPVTGTGSFAGEGSASFVLSTQSSPNSYATLEGIEMQYTGTQPCSLEEIALPFLKKRGVAPQEVGLVLSGYTEDSSGALVFSGAERIAYKELCGDFFTATAFGFWLAVQYLCNNRVLSIKQKPYILLYNKSLGKHHSLILLCHV